MGTLLAADIGGTKSELAIFESPSRDFKPLIRKRYLNQEFTDLFQIITSFLKDVDTVPLYAAIGVAGIVSGRKARLTNIDWRVDCGDLEYRFGFEKAVLVNDLTALCSGINLLSPSDLIELQQGVPGENEVKGVIAPGTGLGQGFLVETGGDVFSWGSEGGHVDFGPVDEEQIALLAWMQQKKRPVSYEMLIAGPGITELYFFCRDYHSISESSEIIERMKGHKDRTPVIVNGAIEKSPCPLCRKTIDLFLSILGSEAGNLALKLYARGGIYVGGGIVPRLSGKVSFAGFMKSFLDKGRMAEIMETIPVNLVVGGDAALLGAVRIGRKI